MEFQHTYFEDEVREGFYISGSIKRAWAAQLEILEEIDKVCKKHNIRWFADCGTLLGAVRHAGYVPWDDDLDICMLRDDYVKFNKVAEKELPEYYEVLNMHKEEVYYEYLTRVTNGHRLNFDEDYLEKYHNCQYATGIDIFPLDYLCPDDEEEQRRRELAKVLMQAADSIDDTRLDKSELGDVVNQIEKLCNAKFNREKPVRQQLFELTETVLSMYPSKGAKHVALMYYWVLHENHKYPIELFDKTVMLPYEVTRLPAPAAYDQVLKIEYGNYMKMVKSGGIHDYPFFHEQEDFLMTLVENYPFIYKFKKEHLLETRNVIKLSKKEAPGFLELLREAHQAIILMLSNGNLEVVGDLLASCQSSAINIGNIIEADYGEGYVTVKILEEYCEVLYEISQVISESEIEAQLIGIIESTLAEIYEKIAYSVQEDILSRKEILFVPFKPDYWYTMDTLYKKYAEDEKNDIYVMPLPYFEKDAKGKLGELHYEDKGYPDYLNTVLYENYDLEKRHPDVIIMQNPYDECNYTASIAPVYYSDKLRKNTEKLIYIPYFMMDDFYEDEKKAVKTMDYFCRVPGIVRADEIILQSEQMKKMYVGYLTEMAGEDTSEIWEKKITTWETLEIEKPSRKSKEYKNYVLANVKAEWKDKIVRADGSLRKVLLTSVGPASLVQNGEKLALKLKNMYDIIEKTKEDIVLIYRPHECMNDVMKNAPSKLVAGYYDIENILKNTDNIIFDEETDIKTLISLCDAYYGDMCSTSRACQVEGKPVMIMNCDVV